MIKEVLTLIILIFASITDIRTREVPKRYQLALLILILFNFRTENLLGLLIAIPFFIAFYFTNGIGGGDWKLITLLGMLSGFHMTCITAGIGCTIFIIGAVIAQRRTGENKMLFPFVPSITAGYIAALVLEAIICNH